MELFEFVAEFDEEISNSEWFDIKIKDLKSRNYSGYSLWGTTIGRILCAR